ncbi:MAG: M56 family metallopeptidase [Planctomycetota bacterium]|jgi:beta-lactamase regulating signal transducer with metallopeptidase domain
METLLTHITDYLLMQSWQIALLVVAVAGVSYAARNRSAHVRYLLWLIVLAKCLVPGLYRIPLAVLPAQEMSEPIVSAPVEQPPLSVEAVDITPMETLVLPPAPVVKPAAPTIADKLAKLTLHQWLAFGWIAGAVLFVLVAVVKAWRTNRWLKRRRKPLPMKLEVRVEDLFAGLGVKSLPKVWLVDGIGQPFVWGLWRGSIYLPADFGRVNGEKDRRGVLGHELSHVMRYDALVNLVQIIAQAVYWFHPFVWWANRKIREEREKCCDEMAIARLNTLPKDYGKAIVNTLIAEHKSARPVPSLAVAGPVKNIEDRIKTIMKSGKTFYHRPTFIAVVTVLLLAAIAVPTTLALTSREEEPASEEATAETETNWGEALNGLRMRVTAPRENVYRQGVSLPLLLEVQNVSDRAIALRELNSILSFRVTDEQGNKIGVEGYLFNHLTSWEVAEGELRPGDIIRETVYFERLPFRRPLPEQSITLRFRLPTQKENPGKLPIKKYSNPITVYLEQPLPQDKLNSDDLPARWGENLDIVYRRQGLWSGSLAVHIDGEGKVTMIALRKGSAIPQGRYKYVIEDDMLDDLISQLGEFRIERLNEFDGKMHATDLDEIYFCLAKEGDVFTGRYQVFGSKTIPVSELRDIIEKFLTRVIEVQAKNSALQAKAEDKLNWGEAVEGLQFGLECTSGKRAYRAGESVSFGFKLRNVGREKIELEYVKSHLRDWAPSVRGVSGGVCAVLPPVRVPPSMSGAYGMGGGEVQPRTLKPGEEWALDKAAFTIRPLGWEGKIEQTTVFAPAGKYRISNMLVFSPPYGGRGRYLWRGQLTSNEIELEIVPGGTAVAVKTEASAEDVQTVLRLLGDYVVQRLQAVSAGSGDTDSWRRNRSAWEARCNALSTGEIEYLGHLANEHPEAGYRAAACEALGETKNARAVELLVGPLGDKAPYVRHRAARALGSLGSEKHIPELLRILKSDTDSGVRAGAAFTLGNIGSKRATKGLVEALESDKEGQVPEAVLFALMWIKDASALPALRAELKQETNSERRRSLENVIRRIEESAWGESVEGVQIRLSPEQPTWYEGQTPVLYLDVRNTGQEDCWFHPASSFLGVALWAHGPHHGPDEGLNLPDVPYESHWYDKIPPGDEQEGGRLLRAGETVEGLQVVLDKRWGRDEYPAYTVGGMPPRITLHMEGLCKVQHCLRVKRTDAKGRPIEVGSFRVYSEPVQTRILPSAPLHGTWGEVVEGVHMRVRAERLVWRQDEIPLFKAQLQRINKDEGQVWEGFRERVEMEVDGQWYRSLLETSSTPFRLTPAKPINDFDVDLDIYHPQWAVWVDKGGNHLELRPGRHIVRVGVTVLHKRPEDSDVQKVTVVSNPVEIEVLELPERVVRFPKDRSVGVLHVQPWRWELVSDNILWQELGQARGDVVVPAGKQLWLQISAAAADDLSFLGSLRPDDLYQLSMYGDVTNAQLEQIRGLTGLRQLEFHAGRITDTQLPHLEPLKGLWVLNLFGKDISDAGLVHLKDMKSLKFLALGRTQVTPAGIRRLKKALPGCIIIPDFPDLKAGEADWGEAVEGLQCRLSADKITWKAGEIPTLKADVRNQGTSEFLIYRTQQLCELGIDGQWYRHKEVSAKSSPFPPGKQYNGIDITLDKRWYSKGAYEPLQLPPGKHIIHVTFVLSDARKGGIEPPPAPVRVVSNPVEIEILPDEQMVLPDHSVSLEKLRQLGKALIIYANDDEQGRFPNILTQLQQRDYIEQKDLAWYLENVEYVGKGKTAADPPDAVLAYDRSLLEKGEGTNVLFNDTHVAFTRPEQLEKLRIIITDKTGERGRRHLTSAAVHKQLDRVVDLSRLRPEMSFSDALEELKKSVKPPLSIVVLWSDLEQNADIDRTTPIDMEGISAIRLGAALELLLKSVSADVAELGYVVKNGVIVVATKESLPSTMETRVYDI